MSGDLREIEARGDSVVLLPVRLLESARSVETKDRAVVIGYPDQATTEELEALLKAARRRPVAADEHA